MTSGPAAPPKTSTQLAEERTTLAGERTQFADRRTSLAVKRTMVALDRTLMAWVRTATTLISFGFTINKFFQSLPAGQAEEARRALLTPRGFALVMIGVGVGVLTLATLEYHGEIKTLRTQYQEYGPFRRSLAADMSTTICGLGILGFVLVVLGG